MGRIYDAMLRFFQEDKWAVGAVPGRGNMVQMQFRGENEVWPCVAQAREAEGQFLFYSLCPMIVPPEKRNAVGEFIARVNFRLAVGSLEIDLDTGEVRFRTWLDLGEEGEPPQALLKRAVYANVLTMDRYIPGIMTIIHTDESPRAALARIEAG